jgi:hypothetical protein
MTTPTIEQLRAEFPHVDQLYALRQGRAAELAAIEYNIARNAINPDDGLTIVRARKRMAKLRKMFPTEFAKREQG